jgi:hypothetical protein
LGLGSVARARSNRLEDLSEPGRDERTAFEARVMLDFMDTRHLRSMQHHYLSERAKAGHVA